MVKVVMVKVVMVKVVMVVIEVQLCIPSDRVSLQIPTPKASGLCCDGWPAHPEGPCRIHDIMIEACLDLNSIISDIVFNYQHTLCIVEYVAYQ